MDLPLRLSLGLALLVLSLVGLAPVFPSLKRFVPFGLTCFLLPLYFPFSPYSLRSQFLTLYFPCLQLWASYDGLQNIMGKPFHFLIQDILQYDRDVDEAISSMAQARRTCA